MPAILRVDVDNPYLPTGLLPKALNRFRIDFEDLFPALPRLGYLSGLSSFLGDIHSRGIAASLFLTRATVPGKVLAGQLVGDGNSIGFHAHRTSDIRPFLKDLHVVQSHFPGAVLQGFSKHGSGKIKLGLRHTPGYDEAKLLLLGSQAGLKYFSGNSEDPCAQACESNGIIWFPGAFWLNPARRSPIYHIAWLSHECGRRDVVCLVHPEEYVTDEKTRSVYERLVGSVDKFITFDDLVRKIPRRGAA